MAVVVTGGEEHDVVVMLMIFIIDSVGTHTQTLFRYVMQLLYNELHYMLYTSKSTRTSVFFVLHLSCRHHFSVYSFF